MLYQLRSMVIRGAAASLLLSTAALAGGGSGTVGFGWEFADHEGDRSVDQATYNIYEGPAFSLTDWTYLFDNGIHLSADLQDATLNNRNLRLNARKPGLFSMALRNTQYRRIYNADQTSSTRRQMSSGYVNVRPHRYVSVFGGVSYVDRHGEDFFAFNSGIDTVAGLVDYTQLVFSGGTRVSCPFGAASFEYRTSDLDDQLDDVRDRTADHIIVTASSQVPRLDWILLAGGYQRRSDKIGERSLELKTNQVWGATKVQLPHDFVADYRILFARTDHSGTGIETDNWHNTVAIGKQWRGRGGVRVGFENRIADDLIGRTVSNGLLLRGWYRHNQRLSGRFQLATRKKEVKTGVTLVGDEDVTRHRLSVDYRIPEWGTVSASWQGRIRSNDDIDSRVDYNTVSSHISLERSRYGRIVATYSYYLGQYENLSDAISYEFSDHLVEGTVYPRAFGNFSVSVGGTYYRSRRDQDVEKFSLRFGAEYVFWSDYRLAARYDVYNFDDYLVSGRYLTSNVVRVEISRDFKI